MKIAVILHRLTFKGGTQRQALILANELQKRGHTVTVYAFEYDPKNTFTDLVRNLKVISLPDYHPRCDVPTREEKLFGVFSRPSYLVWWKKRNRAARKLAHMIDPDTDILNPHAFYVYAVSYYFKKEISNIPAVWMLNTMTLRSWKFWRAQELDPSFCNSLLNRLFYRVMDWVELHRFIACHTITVGDNMNREFVRLYMKKDATVVRECGADMGRFLYVLHPAPKNKKATILLTGVMFEHRRFEDVIDALNILIDQGYDLHLNILGNYTSRPEYHQKLARLIEKYNLGKRVAFWGVVSDEDLIRHHRESDIAIYPNIIQTGGLTVMEYMSSGIPTIVSRGAGVHEILTDGVNALLVDPKSPQAIADAIRRLVDDPTLYTTLSANGRRFVETSNPQSAYADSMLAAFERARSTANL